MVRLQYTVAGLGADLGFDFNGDTSYSYKAADKGELYILYAKLLQSGFFDSYPDVQQSALDAMCTLNATQDQINAAYDALLTASLAEKPSFITDLSEEPIYYGVDMDAEPLVAEASVSEGTLSYEWFSSVDKQNWMSLGDAGADNTIYTPSTAQSGTLYYKCVVTNYDELTGLSNTAESKIASVITGVVTPVFEIDLDETEQSYLSVDSAESLTVSADVTDNGTLTYQWYESNDRISWNPVSNQTTEKYTPDVTKVGTKYYKCTATNTYEGNSSSADSKTAMITVKVDSPEFDTNLRTTSYYPSFDEEFSLSVAASVKDKGTLSYQWYKADTLSMDGSVDGMTPIDGAVSDTYKVDTSKAEAFYYKVKVTNTLQEKTAFSISNWSRVDISVNTPEFTQNLDEREKYSLIGDKKPEALKVEAAVSDGGTVTYQWYESESEAYWIGDMTPITGETKSTFLVDTTKAHTTYYACQATNTIKGYTATEEY